MRRYANRRHVTWREISAEHRASRENLNTLSTYGRYGVGAENESVCKCTLVYFNCAACIKYGAIIAETRIHLRPVPVPGVHHIRPLAGVGLALLPPPCDLPGTRTCRDHAAAQTLSARSTCWIRVCAVSRSARRWCRAVPPTTGCASPGGGSKKFDSVDESQYPAVLLTKRTNWKSSVMRKDN